jgi:hypothetical protein
MRSWVWALGLTWAALMIARASANAACAPANLAGLWDAYSVGADGLEPLWTRCSVRFDSMARITGSSCVTDTGAASTLSGRLTVRSNCLVDGRFTHRFDAGGSLSCNIAQSTLSKDKEVVTGVGKCGGGSAIFSFNMVKR